MKSEHHNLPGGLANLANLANYALEIAETSMNPKDEAKIRRWLGRIGETDEALIAGCLKQCRDDPEALAYYLKRSEEAKAGMLE